MKTRILNAAMVTYDTPEDLPPSLKEIYGLLGKREKVQATFNLGNYTCIQNGTGDKAFFKNKLLDLVPGIRMFLPWEDAPMFMKLNKRVIVILPVDFNAQKAMV